MNFRLTAVEPPMGPKKAPLMWERVLKPVLSVGSLVVGTESIPGV